MRCAVLMIVGCLTLWSMSARAQFLDAALASNDASVTAGASATRYPEPESPLSFDYLKLILDDAAETATVPLHWDAGDWRNFGLISGGIVFTAAVLDKPIKDAAQRNRSKSSDDFFRRIERFGTKQYALPVVAGFYAYGALADDPEAKATALDGFSASVISALTTSALKGVFGRARPNTGRGPHSFKPFHGGASFPSGHATGAFAVAAAIATHYDDNPWIDTAAYGIAGLVGIARIQLNAHWASDVIGGALIGGTIGHHLVNFNRELRGRYALAPTVETDGQQLLLTWQF